MERLPGQHLQLARNRGRDWPGSVSTCRGYFDVALDGIREPGWRWWRRCLISACRWQGTEAETDLGVVLLFSMHCVLFGLVLYFGVACERGGGG